MFGNRLKHDELIVIMTEDNAKLHWIVVANRSRAIFYAKENKHSPLRKILSIDNAAAREKMSNLTSDRSGRSFDSHGQGRHALTDEKSDVKKQADTAFAADIAQRIVSAKTDGSCTDFALIAAPRFLGKLRDALSTHSNMVPEFSVDKDIVGKDIKFIEDLVSKS